MYSIIHDDLLPIQNENVSRETFAPLSSYVDLLLKWNAKINLIGPATESDIWHRHVEDGLQLLPLIPTDTKTLVDLGSGAGLPGIIIAAMRPDIQVTLVEIDQRKSAFLIEAKRMLSLSNISVETTNIRTFKGQFDIVTARALAPLSDLISMASPLLAPTGICIFPKGENYQHEITTLDAVWTYTHHLVASQTQTGAQIIVISNLSQASR